MIFKLISSIVLFSKLFGVRLHDLLGLKLKVQQYSDKIGISSKHLELLDSIQPYDNELYKTALRALDKYILDYGDEFKRDLNAYSMCQKFINNICSNQSVFNITGTFFSLFQFQSKFEDIVE